jgi:hypothetical protein
MAAKKKESRDVKVNAINVLSGKIEGLLTRKVDAAPYIKDIVDKTIDPRGYIAILNEFSVGEKLVVTRNPNIPKKLVSEKKHKAAVKGYENSLENWYLALPILSFNGAKYDLNLMRQYLHKSLEDCGEFVTFSIKKANSYMSIKTQYLQFLDIRSYLAPDYLYDDFIKAYKCKLEKGFFPYDWFNDYDKVNNTELPAHKLFFNKLRNKNIADEEYKVCLNAWKDNNITTFEDFLEWYNNLDVLPFIEAVEK